MPRIALWGGSGLGNVGDRLLMSVTGAELRRRLGDVGVDRFCPWGDGPDAAPLWVDEQGRWPGSGRYDAVVVLGGVWAGPPFRSALLQVFSLGHHPMSFDPDAFVAWHAVGLAEDAPPLTSVGWRDHVGALAGRLDHLTVRDSDAAARFATATGREPAVVPDPVFALDPLPRVRSAKAPSTSGHRRPRLGVAVGDAGAAARVRAMLADARYRDRCRWNPATCYTDAELLAYANRPDEAARVAGFLAPVWSALREAARFADVEFLSVANIYGDEEVAARGSERVPGGALRRVGPSDDGLADALAGYDAVVVSRYHSVVLALRAGVPVVAVDPYWSTRTRTSKLRRLLEDLGISDRHWTYVPGEADGWPRLADLIETAVTKESVEPDVYISAHTRAHAGLDALADAVSRTR